MAKAKKAAAKKAAIVRTTNGFGTKKIDITAELRQLERQYDNGDSQQAYQQLLRLCHQYPDQLAPQQLLAPLALEMNDMGSYGHACFRLMQLQPHNADHVYGFASTLFGQGHMLLAGEMFQKANTLESTKPSPDHSTIAKAEEMIATLQSKFDEIIAHLDLTVDRQTKIAVLADHEWAQVYLHWGEYDKCREFEHKVLARQPDMLPALNNLSLVAYSEEDLSTAIAYAEKVLGIEADNIHALANLVRFSVLSGQFDHAKTCADRLKASQAEAFDPWLKKIEGLSYLGDDASIIELWQNLQHKKQELKILPALGLHFVAVAFARQGNIKQAQELWQTALQLSPSLTLAQANLKNLRQPTAEQHRAWPFSLEYWLTNTMHKELTVELMPIIQAKPEKQKQLCQDYFHRHPHLIPWVEIMLDRGDPATCQLALMLAEKADMPELWKILHQFSLGQGGSEKLRYQTANKLVQVGLLDPQKVRMWIQGDWREVMLLNYQLHDDPPDHHPKIVEELLIKALALLRTQTEPAGIQAEALLKQALAIKTSPDLLNNLAIAYRLQGRDHEAKTLYRQIIDNYPTYVSARVNLAGYHLQAHETNEAGELLKPLLKLQRFHFEDFAFFSEAYLQWLVQEDQIQAAKTWLNLWQQAIPEHPAIDFWQETLKKLSIGNAVTQTLKKLIKSDFSK
jgi:tetratricopeptide (TPR) repeat protein